jgi:hypothetical protein
MSHLQHATTPAPYAIAFSIEELVLVRSWAQQRGLRMTVRTDQVRDGAEFEEMLVVGPPARARPTVTLWRTATRVHAQTPNGRPHCFESLKDCLHALRPVRSQAGGWRRLLGLTG